MSIKSDHPITPPPELRQLWAQQAQRMSPRDPVEWMQHVSEKAAQWGADCELDACCEWLRKEINGGWGLDNQLTTARRPKPPTLKEQALAVLEEEPEDAKELIVFDTDQVNLIRRALDALPDD
jgi:hypothetical protein